MEVKFFLAEAPSGTSVGAMLLVGGPTGTWSNVPGTERPMGAGRRRRRMVPGVETPLILSATIAFWGVHYRDKVLLIFVNRRDTRFPGFHPRLCPLVLQR